MRHNTNPTQPNPGELALAAISATGILLFSYAGIITLTSPNPLPAALRIDGASYMFCSALACGAFFTRPFATVTARAARALGRVASIHLLVTVVVIVIVVALTAAHRNCPQSLTDAGSVGVPTSLLLALVLYVLRKG